MGTACCAACAIFRARQVVCGPTATANGLAAICQRTGRDRCGNPAGGLGEAERSDERTGCRWRSNHWAESKSFSKIQLVLGRTSPAGFSKGWSLQREPKMRPARCSALSASQSEKRRIRYKQRDQLADIQSGETKKPKRDSKDDPNIESTAIYSEHDTLSKKTSWSAESISICSGINQSGFHSPCGHF